MKLCNILLLSTLATFGCVLAKAGSAEENLKQALLDELKYQTQTASFGRASSGQIVATSGATSAPTVSPAPSKVALTSALVTSGPTVSPAPSSSGRRLDMSSLKESILAEIIAKNVQTISKMYPDYPTVSPTVSPAPSRISRSSSGQIVATSGATSAPTVSPAPSTGVALTSVLVTSGPTVSPAPSSSGRRLDISSLKEGILQEILDENVHLASAQTSSAPSVSPAPSSSGRRLDISSLKKSILQGIKAEKVHLTSAQASSAPSVSPAPSSSGRRLRASDKN